ncbi:MAG TPA: SDR family NAD(P)-dependent oxidoreductase [Candidatus Limnocylindrales bacterium]
MEDLTPHIVITGGTSGIGAAAALEMARLGWRVTVVGRDPGRLSAFQGVPRTTALRCDLANLNDVRELAAKLEGQRIDVLANNAGGVFHGSTVDGFDVTMQTNHISPFLLTLLLVPQLPEGARIVNTSSLVSAYGADPTPPSRRFPSAWLAYATSKKANILFAAEATRRWPHLYSFSFHPGVVRTRFGTPVARLFYKYAAWLTSPEKAALQLVWLATEPTERLVNGAYYDDFRVANPRGVATDEAAAARLWEATASLVSQDGR